MSVLLARSEPEASLVQNRYTVHSTVVFQYSHVGIFVFGKLKPCVSSQFLPAELRHQWPDSEYRHLSNSPQKEGNS
jgi:hypothetical protein